MPRRLPLILLLIVLPIWLGASYGVRYLLMEDAQWVGICASDVLQWECQFRAGLGWIIHFGIISWSALGVSLVAFFTRGVAGWRLALPVGAWRCRLAPGVAGWRLALPVGAWRCRLAPGVAGWRLAVLALLLGIAALVLYSASLGVFAVLTATHKCNAHPRVDFIRFLPAQAFARA